MKRLKRFASEYGPQGPRGRVLHGFAFIALCMGLRYLSPWQTQDVAWPYDRLFIFLPQYIWALLWYGCAGWLVYAGFRSDHSKPLGMFAGLLCLWGCMAGYGFVAEMVEDGNSDLWFSCVFYTIITYTCVNIARMVNPPPRVVVKEPSDGVA